MNDGPKTIQQQGRVFQIGAEDCGVSSQHGKGKIGKNQSWKYKSTCENCGTVFAGRSDGPNRFCRNECQHEFSVKRWIKCSECLAKIGLGSKKAGKILGVSPSNVTRQWQKFGIIADRPKSGSIVIEGRKIISQNRGPTHYEAMSAYESACMNDINSQKRGFDWSYLWKLKQIRRISLERYRLMTPEQKHSHNSKWKNRCPILRRKMIREWKAKQRSINPIYRIIEGFRSRLSIIARSKEDHTVDLIGCSPNQLRNHLQSLFKKGMTWDNYGSHWHVDHILPVSSFDHSNDQHIRQCWHWTNLRPMKASDNLSKGKKITEPQLSLLLCATH